MRMKGIAGLGKGLGRFVRAIFRNGWRLIKGILVIPARAIRTLFGLVWIKGNPRETIRRMGGVTVGLAAIIAVLVAIAQLQQSQSASLSADAAQATLIAIGEKQLSVQEAIATVQVGDVRAGPTATAIAEKVAELKSTQEALDAERLRVEAILTAVPPQTVGTPIPLPPSPHVPDVPGLTVEITEITRFQNVLTVKLRLRSTSDTDQPHLVASGSHLLDEATYKTYGLIERSISAIQQVPANGALELWIKYALPAEERPQYLTLVLGHGILFEHLKIP